MVWAMDEIVAINKKTNETVERVRGVQEDFTMLEGQVIALQGDVQLVDAKTEETEG